MTVSALKKPKAKSSPPKKLYNLRWERYLKKSFQAKVFGAVIVEEGSGVAASTLLEGAGILEELGFGGSVLVGVTEVLYFELVI